MQSTITRNLFLPDNGHGVTIWLRRLRGVLGMGLVWAMGGAAVGGVIELLDNVLPGGLPGASAVDMWPQTLAIPAFLGGLIFAVVLFVAAGRRRFDELSLPVFAALGALAGLILGSKGVSAGLPVFVLAITTLGGALAASGSLMLARRAARRDLLTAGTDSDASPVLDERVDRQLGDRH